MNIEKFSQDSIAGELKHVDRLLPNDRNKDIDPGRTPLNYTLSPNVSDSAREKYRSGKEGREEVRRQEFAYYNFRKSELFCLNRRDVKPMAGCVITLPKEVTEPSDIERFFEGATQFLFERYGGSPTADGRMYPNIVSVTVHFDERAMGQPHAHVYWIPTVKIDHAALGRQKIHNRNMDRFEEKISAKECLTRADLRTLHHDMQAYLDERGIKGRVVMKPEGGGKNINLTVAQLKELTDKYDVTVDKTISLEKMADLIKKANAYDRSQSRGWGKSSEWGKSSGWGHDKDKKEDLSWSR